MQYSVSFPAGKNFTGKSMKHDLHCIWASSAILRCWQPVGEAEEAKNKRKDQCQRSKFMFYVFSRVSESSNCASSLGPVSSLAGHVIPSNTSGHTRRHFSTTSFSVPKFIPHRCSKILANSGCDLGYKRSPKLQRNMDIKSMLRA